MTVTAQVPSYIQIPGNGTGTVFAFPFKCFAATDVLVGFVVAGAYAAQSSGFTVGNIDVNGGGTVTFAVPPPNGTLVDIRTVTPLIQPSEFANLGAFLPEVHTDTFDRVVRELQDVFRRTYTFGLHGPDTESTPWPALPSAAARANTGLVFDSNGLPAPGVLPTSPVTQSVIGGLFYPQLVGEVGVTNTLYPYYNVRRYGADPTASSSSVTAFNNAYASAMAASPHGAIYIPAGTYLIDSGLVWTNQNDIRVMGDGPQQSVLVGGVAGGYTILTVSADIGIGTSGTNLNLSNFGIKYNPSSIGTQGLSLSDYQYCTLNNLLVYASGNALTMAGMAVITAANLDILCTGNNFSNNSALVLTADTHGNANGPGVFNGCQFNANGNVTQGAAITSVRTAGIVFNGCFVQALGAGLVSVAEFANDDDVTFIECYGETSTNTTNNTAVMFYLGRTANVANFTMIGGTLFTGNGFFSLKYGVVGNQIGLATFINVTWAGFNKAAISYANNSATQLTIINNNSSGAGNPPVLDPANQAGGTGNLPFWTSPNFQWPSPITTGFGTPTGQGMIANFQGTGGTYTNAQLAGMISVLAATLKAAGIGGA